ncbi:DMT family transporter [Elongatibacter sediminis]|uniref:DMT family transporter n=1 Tax=Elongatibacter sediminis TaxID=3119006 RepID=A0AAW9RNW6_9GAMM
MQSNHHTENSAHAGMLLWAVIVGLSFPVVGLMSPGMPPLLLTSLRFAIAAAALWPFARRAAGGPPGQRARMLYALMGLCQAGFFGSMFWSAHRVSAVSMSTLYATVPLIAYVLGRLFAVETPAARMLRVLSLGAAGAMALAWAQHPGGVNGIPLGWGECVFFAGCVASALHPVLTKWGLRHGVLQGSATVRTFWSLVAGSILIGLAGLLVENPIGLGSLTWLDGGLLIWLGVFSSGVTFWLTQRAAAALTPAAVTAYSYLVPFVSLLILFLQHPRNLGWHWLPGSLLVVTATCLLAGPGAGSKSRTPRHAPCS